MSASAESSRPLIEIENLHVRFAAPAAPWVVRDVSFTVNRGECVAIVGESGSGKSVTARTLLGLAGHGAEIRATRLAFDNENLLELDERGWRAIRGARVGFVMQDALGSLDPLRTVAQEIAEPLKLHTTLTRAQRDERVLELLAQVGMPDPAHRAQQHPHQLSGGLRQRALIAAAIACRPELIIADEPTTALDTTVQARVLALLASLRSADTGMLIISHDLAVVSRLADRVIVMHHGVIVEQGLTVTVLTNPQHAYTRSLMAAHAAIHTRHPHTPNILLPVRDTQGIVNFNAFAARPRTGGDAEHPVIEARQLAKSFPGPAQKRRAAVSEVSFKLTPGQTLGIVGESGSGKTTLIRMILGLEKPDHGSVHLAGADWSALSAQARRLARKRIQIIFQDPLGSFDPRYTVERVLEEALAVGGCPPDRWRERAVELLELVRLDESYLARRPIELSGGQRQRVAIARALAPNPEVLVCDEPVSALDVSVQAQILALLADLKERLGLSCLFISHDLGIIYRVCDHLIVMKDGVVVESGAVREVFDNPRHDYTRALLNAIPRLHAPESHPAAV